MSEHKKIRLTPLDPYFTIEIDFSEDLEHIREQIQEKRRGPEPEPEPESEPKLEEERVSPNQEADSPSEEANTDTNK